tara:strand:+ start:1266 stop:1427 length:162 start_codon:yes stop_codon:yes gene_type:complete
MENETIHVYDFDSEKSFQFTRLTDFLGWANNSFDCEKHIATTNYEKLQEIINA